MQQKGLASETKLHMECLVSQNDAPEGPSATLREGSPPEVGGPKGKSRTGNGAYVPTGVHPG